MPLPKLEPFDRAIALHQQGQTGEAAAIYRDVIGRYPDHAGAWHLLGVTQFQAREFDLALASIARAIELDAGQAAFYNNYGAVLQEVGRLPEALAAFRAALQIRPEYADAQLNLAGIVDRFGQWERALAAYERVLALAPDHAEALAKAARVAQRLTLYERAVELLQRALGKASPSPSPCPLPEGEGKEGTLTSSATGTVNDESGTPRRAFPTGTVSEGLGTLTSSATGKTPSPGPLPGGKGKLRPQVTEHGSVLRGEGKSRAELFNDLGNALVGGGRGEEAVAAYRQAIAYAPAFASAHYNLGVALAEMGQVETAKDALAAGRRIAPHKRAWELREMVICPVVFDSAAALDEYRASLEKKIDGMLEERRESPGDGARLRTTSEARGEEPLGRNSHEFRYGEGDKQEIVWRDLLTTAFVPPFALAFQGRKNRGLKEKFAQVCRGWFAPQPRRPRKTDRLRVGFVVTRGHEGVFLRCTAGIIQHLDKARFEPVILCGRGLAARMRQLGLPADIPYVEFGEDFREAVLKIESARCDVLYHWEVGSDAMNYFLPFMRLAPVQCTSWGTQVTSGLAEVDYYLSSELIELPAADEHYTEKLWRLKSRPTYQRRIPAPPPTSRDYFGLPDDKHLYLCPQNLLKLHPDQDELFGQLLRTDPAGLLLIKEGRYRHPAQQLQKRLARTIPDVLSRVRFIPWQSVEDYFRLVSIADVVLDVLYYTAGSSCYDMFSLNQPIITLPGELNVGRYTQACYRQMGFTDLVAHSPDEYISKAVHLASNPDYRHHVRQTLAERTPLLFEDLTAVREHERFFEEAFASLAKGKGGASFLR